MEASLGLPKSIISQAGAANLHVVFPKIWTQKESRVFGIYWAPEVNHGTLYPPPTDDELAAFYRQEHYDRYLSGEVGHQQFADPPMTLAHRVVVKIAYIFDRSAAAPLSKILKYSPNRPSVCDLGCGGGTFLQTIEPYASQIVGVDPSEVSASAVKIRGIEFHKGTADNLPAGIERGIFDVVTMFHSLEHVRDVKQSLANTRDLLKPGGLLVIEVPNMDCLGFQIYPEVWIHTDAGRHLQFFTPKSLYSFCKEAELTPIDCEFTGFTHQFLPSRVNKMQIHWDVLFKDADVSPVAVRASFLTSLRHLFRSLLSGSRERYDIVRIYARRSL